MLRIDTNTWTCIFFSHDVPDRHQDELRLAVDADWWSWEWKKRLFTAAIKNWLFITFAPNCVSRLKTVASQGWAFFFTNSRMASCYLACQRDIQSKNVLRPLYCINSRVVNRGIVSSAVRWAGSGCQAYISWCPELYTQRLTGLYRCFDNPVSTAVHGNAHTCVCCFLSWEKMWSAAGHTLLREEKALCGGFQAPVHRCRGHFLLSLDHIEPTPSSILPQHHCHISIKNCAGLASHRGLQHEQTLSIIKLHFI